MRLLDIRSAGASEPKRARRLPTEGPPCREQALHDGIFHDHRPALGAAASPSAFPSQPTCYGKADGDAAPNAGRWSRKIPPCSTCWRHSGPSVGRRGERFGSEDPAGRISRSPCDLRRNQLHRVVRVEVGRDKHIPHPPGLAGAVIDEHRLPDRIALRSKIRSPTWIAMPSKLRASAARYSLKSWTMQEISFWHSEEPLGKVRTLTGLQCDKRSRSAGACQHHH